MRAASSSTMAARIRRDDATVNNALGPALLASGNADEAIARLAWKEQYSEALNHFREAVGLNPADANAEANLGGAVARWRKPKSLAEAKLHMQKAIQRDPANTLAYDKAEEVERQGK